MSVHIWQKDKVIHELEDSVELYEEECDKCEQIFEPRQMKAHREKEHEEWTCPFCGEICCGSKTSLSFFYREHLTKEHTEDKAIWKDTEPGWPYNGIFFQMYNNGKPLGRTLL